MSAELFTTGSPEERSKFISDHPLNFKVCDCCDSIVFRHIGVCPVCAAYTFNTDESSVKAAAVKLADPNYTRTTVTMNDLLG